MRRVKKSKTRSHSLNRQEMRSSGVCKILLDENSNLKKSLKQTQDELETMRTNFHTADKENSVLNSQLNNALLPELIKLIASAGGVSFGVNYISSNNPIVGCVIILISILIYAGVVWYSRRR